MTKAEKDKRKQILSQIDSNLKSTIIITDKVSVGNLNYVDHKKGTKKYDMPEKQAVSKSSFLNHKERLIKGSPAHKIETKLGTIATLLRDIYKDLSRALRVGINRRVSVFNPIRLIESAFTLYAVKVGFVKMIYKENQKFIDNQYKKFLNLPFFKGAWYEKFMGSKIFDKKGFGWIKKILDVDTHRKNLDERLQHEQEAREWKPNLLRAVYEIRDILKDAFHGPSAAPPIEPSPSGPSPVEPISPATPPIKPISPDTPLSEPPAPKKKVIIPVKGKDEGEVKMPVHASDAIVKLAEHGTKPGSIFTHDIRLVSLFKTMVGYFHDLLTHLKIKITTPKVTKVSAEKKSSRFNSLNIFSKKDKKEGDKTEEEKKDQEKEPKKKKSFISSFAKFLSLDFLGIGVLVEGLVKAFGVFSTMAGHVLGVVSSVFSGISGLLASTGITGLIMNIPVVGTMLSSIGTFFGGIAGWSIGLSGLAAAIGSVVLVGGIIVGIAGLFGAITGFFRAGEIEEFKKQGVTLSNRISAMIGGFFSGITFGLIKFEDAALVVDNILNFFDFKGTLMGIGDAFKDLWDALKDLWIAVKPIVKLIVNILKPIIIIIGGVLLFVLKAIGEFIKLLVGGLKSVINTITLLLIPISMIADLLNKAFDYIWIYFKELFKLFHGIFTRNPKEIVDAAKVIWDNLLTLIKNIITIPFKWLFRFFKKMGTILMDYITIPFDFIINSVLKNKNKQFKLKDFFKEVVDKAWQWIKDQFTVSFPKTTQFIENLLEVSSQILRFLGFRLNPLNMLKSNDELWAMAKKKEEPPEDKIGDDKKNDKKNDNQPNNVKDVSKNATVIAQKDAQAQNDAAANIDPLKQEQSRKAEFRAQRGDTSPTVIDNKGQIVPATRDASGNLIPTANGKPASPQDSYTGKPSESSGTIAVSGKGKEAAEQYYGKKMSDKEYDMLVRATHAESSSKSDPKEQAMIMGSILNRAKTNKNGIEGALTAKNQFQSVTGTKANGNQASSNYINGPKDKERRESIENAAGMLGGVPTDQKNFTAANSKAYGAGTNIGYRDKMIANGGHVYASSVFDKTFDEKKVTLKDAYAGTDNTDTKKVSAIKTNQKSIDDIKAQNAQASNSNTNNISKASTTVQNNVNYNVTQKRSASRSDVDDQRLRGANDDLAYI